MRKKKRKRSIKKIRTKEKIIKKDGKKHKPEKLNSNQKIKKQLQKNKDRLPSDFIPLISCKDRRPLGVCV